MKSKTFVTCFISGLICTAELIKDLGCIGGIYIKKVRYNNKVYEVFNTQKNGIYLER